MSILSSTIAMVSVLLFVFSASAAAQGQTNRIDLRAEGGRPVAEAVQALTKKHPFVITYEDPRYEFQADIKDVTLEVRNPLAPPNPEAKVLVPAGGSLALRYEVSAETSEPVDVAATLQQIVAASELSGTGGRFEVERSGQAFHVIPKEVRNSRGLWVQQGSILDATITIPSQELNGFEMLSAFCAAVTEAVGIPVNVGTVSPNLFNRYQGHIAANSERARDVLTRILGSISDRLTWRLLYDPSGKFGYALNIKAVAARPEPETPVETPAQPRPGGPSPTGGPGIRLEPSESN